MPILSKLLSLFREGKTKNLTNAQNDPTLELRRVSVFLSSLEVATPWQFAIFPSAEEIHVPIDEVTYVSYRLLQTKRKKNLCLPATRSNCLKKCNLNIYRQKFIMCHFIRVPHIRNQIWEENDEKHPKVFHCRINLRIAQQKSCIIHPFLMLAA